MCPFMGSSHHRGARSAERPPVPRAIPCPPEWGTHGEVGSLMRFSPRGSRAALRTEQGKQGEAFGACPRTETGQGFGPKAQAVPSSASPAYTSSEGVQKLFPTLNPQFGRNAVLLKHDVRGAMVNHVHPLNGPWEPTLNVPSGRVCRAFPDAVRYTARTL